MDSLNSADLHTVISKTYQNIFDISPVLKELSTAARTYHKALQNVSSAASSFHQALSKISQMASSSQGPAKPLGETIEDIMDTHRDVENRRQEIVKLMMTDLIIPLESLVESDNVYVKVIFPLLQAVLKNYNHDNKTKVEYIYQHFESNDYSGVFFFEQLVEKARTELLKVRKKSQRKKPTEKYEEKEKQCDEYHNNLQRQLENFRRESCQRSLSEEWKRYVFVVDRSSIFMKSYMDFYDHNAAMLREKLSVWFSQVKKKPGCPDYEINGSIAQEVDSLGPMTQRLALMLNYVGAHFHCEITPPSVMGDIIDPISEVVSGWQYGQNLTTSKSGWFPATYTQEIVAVPTGSNVSQTMPSTGVHSRPQLEQGSGHKSLKRYSSASTMAIPMPDYHGSTTNEQGTDGYRLGIPLSCDAEENLEYKHQEFQTFRNYSSEPLTPPVTPSKSTPSTPTASMPARRPLSEVLLPPPPPPPPSGPPESEPLENNNE
ncbi:hypothetical protein QZH41_011632, partial [Actinostola sp. cb2023]